MPSELNLESMSKILNNLEKSIKKDINALLEETVRKQVTEAISKHFLKLEEKFHQTIEEINYLQKEIENLKTSQQFISDEYENFKSKQIKIIDQEKNANETILQLEKQILNEPQKLENLEQYGQLDNLEFHEIPQTPNEDTDEIICNLVKKLNIEIDKKEISASHRLPIRINVSQTNAIGKDVKLPPIIVKFARKQKRNI